MTKHNDTNASQSTPSATRGLLVRTDLRAGTEGGTVKSFNPAKGGGVIKMDGTGKEIAVHVSGLQDEIHVNDHVLFDLEFGRRATAAINVRRG
jgi:cold shock protein